MIKKIVFGMLVLFLGAALIYGCGQTSSSSGGGTVTPTSQNWGIITGTVTDESGSFISGASVEVISSLETTMHSVETNGQGWFSISNIVPNYPVLVTFSKANYVTTYRVVAIRAGQSIYVNATLLANGAPTAGTVAGGVIAGNTSSSGVVGSVTLPPNVSLLNANGTAYTGNAINVSVKTGDITIPADFNAFPGEFVGQSLTSGTVDIASFGYISGSITDGSGNPLSLGPNQTATITIQVPAALLSSAPATIPLWYFDPATRTWIEQGSATLTGNVYSGTVTHLSTWNFDVPITRAYISGKVVDTNGNPVPNAQVYCNGANWKSGDYGTASDGTFTRIRVAANQQFTIYAQSGSIVSAVQTIALPGIAAGQEMTGVVLVLDATKVFITLTWGLNPSDEDSHLTVPQSMEGVGQRYDLFYGNRTSTPSTRWPSVNLDTDDTSSYGPEVTTIYKLYPGTYRFNVHHYAGSGNIYTSPSQVVLSIPSGPTAGNYTFSAPAGATDTSGGASAAGDVWQVFDLQVNATGIYRIDTLGTWLHNISAGSHSSFSPGGADTTATASGVRGAELLKK